MSEPTPPASETPDERDTISFPFNGEVITIAVGDDVGLDTYILPLEDFTPEWQAVLLGENPPKLTVKDYNSSDLFTARNAAGEHAFFRINDDDHLQLVTPAEILLNEDYRDSQADGDDDDDVGDEDDGDEDEGDDGDGT